MEGINKQKNLVRTWIRLEKYLGEFETEEEQKKKTRPLTGMAHSLKTSAINITRPNTGKLDTQSV